MKPVSSRAIADAIIDAHSSGITSDTHDMDAIARDFAATLDAARAGREALLAACNAMADLLVLSCAAEESHDESKCGVAATVRTARAAIAKVSP